MAKLMIAIEYDPEDMESVRSAVAAAGETLSIFHNIHSKGHGRHMKSAGQVETTRQGKRVSVGMYQIIGGEIH